MLFAERRTPIRFVFRALACPALASVLHAPLLHEPRTPVIFLRPGVGAAAEEIRETAFFDVFPAVPYLMEKGQFLGDGSKGVD